MRTEHPQQQAKREHTLSLVRATWRQAGVRVAYTGLSALMASQLLVPGIAIAAEPTDATAAQPEAVTAASPAPTADPTPDATADPTPVSTDPAPAADPTPVSTDSAPAADPAPTAEKDAEPKPATDPKPAATPRAATKDGTAKARGVTDVVGGEGGVKIDTTVVEHYYDCELPSAVTLGEGETRTFDLADAPDAMVDMLKAETRYYKADNASHALVETGDPSESVVTLSIAPVEKHLRVTLTFSGGTVDSGAAYSLKLSSSEKVGSTLTYNSTDYEGNIIGDPDDIFNTGQQGGSVVIHETRDDYYLRHAIDTNLTLVAADAQDIQTAVIENVKWEYAPGETPQATATVAAADADKYEIAYECWEQMEGDDPANLTPVAFWYSDDSKYVPGMKKITQFEEGKFYMHSVELRLKDGYEFAPDVDATANGIPMDYVIHTVNGLFIPNAGSMLCEEPIDEWQAIDTVEIQGATTSFKAGDKPVFTAGTPAGSNYIFQCEFWTGDDKSDVNSEKFWDQNITNHIDSFKAGVTYHYGVYLKAARGFYFTPDTKLVINGQPVNYTRDANDSEIGFDRMDTMWVFTDLAFTPEAAEPTPDPKPDQRPETKPTTEPASKPTSDANKTAKPATKAPEKVVKPATGTLPATGDTTAMMIAALSIAGATIAAAGTAVEKRRNS